MTNIKREKTEVAEAYKIFFEAVKTDNLSVVVESAWRFFGVPVLVTDENYKLVCMYPNHTIGVDIWDTLYRKKILPDDIIRSYTDFYLIYHDRFYEPFYVNEGPAEKCPRIFAEIHDDKHIFGHTALFFFDAPLYDQDIDCVRIFVDALTIMFSSRRSSRNSTLSTYLLEAINGSASDDMYEYAVNKLASNIPGGYTLMVTPMGGQASSRAFMTMAKENISAVYADSVSTVYDSCVVTLFGKMKGGPQKPTLYNKIRSCINPGKHSSGISQVFTDIRQLRERYFQAYYTARYKSSPCILYDDVAPLPVFEMIKHQTDPGIYVHPLIQSITDYDRDNNSEYLRTIREYILSFRDKDEASKRLNIHKNTLMYRINRIEDIFKVDLSDSDLSRSLLVSFLLI